jgi:hypothetical protein
MEVMNVIRKSTPVTAAIVLVEVTQTPSWWRRDVVRYVRTN